MPSNSSFNVNNSSSLHKQGIWSTMKHLMRQGNHGHSANQQFSHAHVYTLAGNPPNVVDLTTANNGAESASTTASMNKTKRPWSKQNRVLRNATIQDITAHGMIRASSSVGSIPSNAAANNSTAQSNNVGFKRLWRGVQTMFVGCIPAHALYFSSYEIMKSTFTDQNHHQQHEGHVGHDTLSPTQAMLAGGGGNAIA